MVAGILFCVYGWISYANSIVQTTNVQVYLFVILDGHMAYYGVANIFWAHGWIFLDDLVVKAV